MEKCLMHPVEAVLERISKEKEETCLAIGRLMLAPNQLKQYHPELWARLEEIVSADMNNLLSAIKIIDETAKKINNEIQVIYKESWEKEERLT